MAIWNQLAFIIQRLEGWAVKLASLLASLMRFSFPSAACLVVSTLALDLGGGPHQGRVRRRARNGQGIAQETVGEGEPGQSCIQAVDSHAGCSKRLTMGICRSDSTVVVSEALRNVLGRF